MKPVALTIAGSDPSGGAGLQADLKTFHQFGVYGTSVVTLLTVQNTLGVQDLKLVDAEFVAAQLKAVLDDLRPNAIKTGALGSAAIVESVARQLSSWSVPLVVDPVLVSKHGDRLAEDDVRDALIEQLLPKAVLVTPNRHEATVLSGVEVSDTETALEAAATIAQKGPVAVVITGLIEGGQSVDVLWRSGEYVQLKSEAVQTKSTHGTGCTFSASITAELARGTELEQAAQRAKAYIALALATAPGLGSGIGPVNHHASTKELDIKDPDPRA